MVVKRYLIITIDTEEEFDWHHVPFLPIGGSVENIGKLCRLQKIFARLNAKVTYFVDFPVLKNEVSRNILRRFLEQYSAEMGTHLHPWCTPPFEEELNIANTMANMLPANLVRSKLETLTEVFVEAFGFRPVSYRAGRFAFDGVSAKIIEDLGYKIDSSITPFYDWSKSYGPDFFFAPFRPYFINGEDIFLEDKKGGVLEVPISAGFNRSPFKVWSKIYSFARKGSLRYLRLVGALDRSNFLKRIILGPELQSLGEMKNLVENLLRENIQVFNMIFHSSSLIPGGNSIIKTIEEAGAFEKRVIDIVSWIIEECGAEPIRLSDYFSIKKAGEPVGDVEAGYNPCGSK